MNIRTFLLILMLGVGLMPPALAGNGNPRPGYAHDTIIIHVQKGENGPKNCDGGNSLFLRHFDGIIPETYIDITMVDWNQVDNDNDGLLDEDPVNEIDDDGDGFTDEDPVEAGAETTALDCDAWGDQAVALQIRDTDPRPGYISTQEWFMRLIGRPEENFAFTSFANQTVSCSVEEGDDGILGTDDDVATCVSGESEDWVELASFNLAVEGCVKQVKLGGKGKKAGGKTQFCDITEGFLVDVITADTNGDGVIDEFDDTTLYDQFIFSISCVDNPDTPEVDETLYCPLSSVIWDIDEDNTTSRATVQIFVSHTGAAQVKSGKLKKSRP